MYLLVSMWSKPVSLPQLFHMYNGNNKSSKVFRLFCRYNEIKVYQSLRTFPDKQQWLNLCYQFSIVVEETASELVPPTVLLCASGLQAELSWAVCLWATGAPTSRVASALRVWHRGWGGACAGDAGCQPDAQLRLLTRPEREWPLCWLGLLGVAICFLDRKENWAEPRL